jgi:hypothetical protein
MSHGPDYTPVYESMANRSENKNLKMACFAGIAIGVAATAYGLFTEGVMVPDPEGLSDATFSTNTLRVQGSFIQNFMYFNGAAQGGFLMSVIGVTTYARWNRPFKRVAEGLAMFLPVSYALMLLFLALGGIDVFPWHHQGHAGLEAAGAHHKATYFDTGFFWARQILGLGLMTGLSYYFVQLGLRADLGVAKEEMSKRGLTAPADWDKKLQNWQGAEAEVKKAQEKMITIAPVISIAYALIYSMVAVDISMSLAPYFFANMYPAWYFMSAIWSGLVWTAIFTITHTKTLGLENIVKRNNLHDLGKLTFAFCMFWGYTTFAQYLPIWYGNMTEEIGFILYRTHSETFATFTQVTLLLCFFAPYVIFLSRGLKKQLSKYFVVVSFIAFGIWFECYIVNMPSIHSYWMVDAEGNALIDTPFSFIEIGMGLGFLGLFVFVVTSYLNKYPGAVVADPYMEPDPREVHVHAHH